MTKRLSKHGFDNPTGQIRDAITGGSFFPNERLIEEDLVQRFKTNRGAIRLALARLEQEGLVMREPNRGARVRLVSEKEAIEIMEARAMLESLLARHAALKATPQDIKNLREILRELAGLIKNGDMVGYVAANMRFHSTIVDIAAHPTAARLLLGLRAQSVVFQYRRILQPGRVATVMHEHEKLVRVLASKNPDAAEKAMRSHWDDMATALKARLQRSSC
jgi:DNA-binding GntR family transcriptional regulator